MAVKESSKVAFGAPLEELVKERRTAQDIIWEGTSRKKSAEKRITNTLFKTNRFDLLTVNWRKLEKEVG